MKKSGKGMRRRCRRYKFLKGEEEWSRERSILLQKKRKKSRLFLQHAGVPLNSMVNYVFFMIVIKWRLDQLSVNILQNEK